MVAGKDDHRIVRQPAPFETIAELANGNVDAVDQLEVPDLVLAQHLLAGVAI